MRHYSKGFDAVVYLSREGGQSCEVNSKCWPHFATSCS